MKHTIDDRAARRRDSQRGATLVETAITVALIVSVLLGVYATFGGSLQSYTTGSVRSELQQEGRRALKRILDELRVSGIFEDPDLGNRPAVFTFDPEAENPSRGDFRGSLSLADLTRQEPPPGTVPHPDRSQRNAGRISEELVFKLPRDADGDGRPTNATTGMLEWDLSEISYRVDRAQTGEWRVSRFVDGFRTGTLGRHVRKVTFDVLSFDASVPRNQVAVTLFLEKATSEGQVISVAMEGSIQLRNTTEL